jgi:transformer-2 protein
MPNSTKFSCSRSHSRSRKMSYRGRYRSRSRSRSPKRYKSRYSHSRSRSYSPRGKYYGYSDRRKEFYRSHSRSPMSSRRRHVGSRVSLTNLGNYLLNSSVCSKYFTDSFAFQDNPQPSRCLGIFGLSIYTTEQQLHHIMSKYGPVERVQVVIDAKVSNVPYSLNCMSRRCRVVVLPGVS